MAENETWGAPQCPFVVEYAPGALDDVRMAVSDAFFSVPRGGAEIGGILLGKWEPGRLTVSGYAALNCEHAFGPSFTLSERDRSKLAGLIASAEAEGAQVAGWYHSHTRSEIHLSNADLEIYTEFFKEPWQVALVLKPDTFRPTRAGFFFREDDGSIHSHSAYQEFTLEPIATKPFPSGAPGIPGISPASEVVVDALPVASAPPPVSAPPSPFVVAEAVLEPPRKSELPPPVAEKPAPLPRFLDETPPAARKWPKVVIPLLIAAGLAAAAYWARDAWIPRVTATTRTSQPPAPPVGLGLNTLDFDGQLQIRWNRNSPAVLQATGGILTVGGEAPAQEIPLDHAHLLSGVFTVARQSERVDVALTLTQPGNRQIREVTSFLGKLPERSPVKAAAAAPPQRDKLAEEVAKVKSELEAEIQRSRKMQKSVDLLAKQLRDQQRARLLNQAPPKK